MNRFKPHIALLICNIVWAMDYPFYNIVLPRYVHPMAMVSGSLIATALFSLVPLLWQKAEKVAKADVRKLIGAALLIGVLRKVFIMYGLSMTSPIDGSIIDTIVPLLVLLLSVLLGMDRFTKLKIAGLVLGMAGAVAVVLAGASSSHQHSHLWGNVMILLCACVTSLYMVWFKRLIAKYRITTVLRWLYCVAAVVALPFGLKEIVHTDYAAIAKHALFPTLFVLTVPTYLPNLMLNYALKSVPATVSSIYTYLQPVLAIAISVGMGLDKLHADTVIFALVIFVGVGLVLRGGGCLDGTETVALLISRKTRLSVGQIVFGCNVIIYAAAGILFGLDRAMYSLLTYFITFKIIDVVENGMEEVKSVMIITEDGDYMANAIYHQIGRTCTILAGTGLISGDKAVLYCVVTRIELPAIRRIIRQADQSAFVTISDVGEVIGNHMKQPPAKKDRLSGGT